MAKKSKKSAVYSEKKKLVEDISFFKSSVLFLMLCAVVLFTLRVDEIGSRTFAMMTASWLPFAYGHVQLLFIFGVLTIASAVYFIICRKNKKDESLSYISSLNLLCLSGFCTLYCFTFSLDMSSIKLLVVTAVCGAFYYITKFYDKDFVYFYLFNVLLCFNIWSLFGNAASSRPALSVILKLAGIIGIAAVCYFTFAAKKKAGKVSFNIWPFAVSAIFFAALAVLMLTVQFVTPTVALVVMLIQFVAAAVYYTVKVLN